MLSNEEIEQQLRAVDNVVYVKVDGDGYQYHLLIVTNEFEGLSKVARQQWVYAQLKEFITTGRLHALTMKTLTEAEWETQRG